ncbi:hypothetical protein LPB67_01995 [Undibacterium sp. Jales W-56]|uniref:hypothetical protein n=1 Tax=Undibacterium sp. Jales W-56 TaxID=2897325 RepID=UPI0021D05551|nr:hypothetical protein [Undibacterium sp. Jales W-56]MCU6432550.1 hypothetical protein [Undibacterium sp. Jales W-56]
MKHSTNGISAARKILALAVIVGLGGLAAYAGVNLSSDDKTPVASANKPPSAAKPVTATATTAWGSSPLQLVQANGTALAAALPLAVNAVPAVNTVAANIEMPDDFVPSSAEGSTDRAPFARINLDELSSGQRAITLLASHLDAVANWYGMSSDSLKQLLLSDSTVHVDRKGRLLHIDSGVTAAGDVMHAATASVTTKTTIATPFPLDQTFKLHTKSNSTRLLYLNFTGFGKNPAFDLDKAPATFSDAERLLIQKVWLRVAEDYAPFDVDITTEAPTVVTGKVGVMILITPQTNTAGGYAYLNAFNTYNPNSSPAFCFPNNLANSEKPIAECISHELGHTLGLLHQGSSSTEYYTGQGDGETGWAPIMGVGYYKNLTQWAKGEYTGANNKLDTYAIMLRQGLRPRSDDHGGTIASADAMTSTIANGFNNVHATGIIEVPGDIDMLSFNAGAGPVILKAVPAALGGNLDISLQLLDATGKVIATSNDAATLGTALTATLTASGTYYLSVTGAGKGSPLQTGYSNYGSLGQYSISGTTPITTAAPVAKR